MHSDIEERDQKIYQLDQLNHSLLDQLKEEQEG